MELIRELKQKPLKELSVYPNNLLQYFQNIKFGMTNRRLTMGIYGLILINYSYRTTATH